MIARWQRARLCIAGVDSFVQRQPRLAALPPRDQVDCTILLAHNPDQAEHLGRAAGRVDLVLSGHTHGGQVRLPWIGALRNPAHHADLYEAGLRIRPWAQVYVSRGVGTVHLPIRFLCQPELVILELARLPERGSEDASQHGRAFAIGVGLNVLKEELPEDRESRFWAFALGLGAYMALLLAL